MKIEQAAVVLPMLLLSSCVTTDEPVSFQRDVYPTLEANCIPCHSPPEGKGYMNTGLNMASYEDLMRGSKYARVITPGDSRHSILNMLVEGRADPSICMPHGREPLSGDKVEMLRLWVDQGAANN